MRFGESVSTRARSWSSLALAATVLGCGSAQRNAADGGPPDAGQVNPGRIDAGGGDGGPARMPDAGPAAEDAGPADAGPCPECPPPTDSCRVHSCGDEGCVIADAADGTFCDEAETSLCVDGLCVPRGCGDGYRERPPSPFREDCDDGNAEDGDGCSSTCNSEVRTFESDEAGRDVLLAGPESPVGVDGAGRVLFAWHSRPGDGSEVAEIRAVRTGRGGGPLAGGASAPFAVTDDREPSSTLPGPVTVGLPDGGWVVAWIGDRADRGTQVLHRVVRPDGTMSAIQPVEDGPSRLPRTLSVVATDEGYTIVWSELLGRSGLREDLRARRFRAGGAALGESFEVASRPAGEQHAPTAAAQGDVVLVAWRDTDRGAGRIVPSLYLRRLDRGEPLDPVQSWVDDDVFAARAVPLDDGAFLVVWSTSRPDESRHIQAIRVADAPDGGLELGPVIDVVEDDDAFEDQPSAAPAGASDALVGFLLGPPTSRTADLTRVGPGTDPLPPDPLATLRAALATDAPAELSLTRGVGGIWVTWTRLGRGRDPRLATFFLPLD